MEKYTISPITNIIEHTNEEYMEFLLQTNKLERIILNYIDDRHFNKLLQQHGVIVNEAGPIYKNLLVSKILENILNPNILYLIR